MFFGRTWHLELVKKNVRTEIHWLNGDEQEQYLSFRLYFEGVLEIEYMLIMKLWKSDDVREPGMIVNKIKQNKSKEKAKFSTKETTSNTEFQEWIVDQS